MTNDMELREKTNDNQTKPRGDSRYVYGGAVFDTVRPRQTKTK